MDLPVPITVLLVHTAIKDLDSESRSFSGLGLDLNLAVAGYKCGNKTRVFIV